MLQIRRCISRRHKRLYLCSTQGVVYSIGLLCTRSQVIYRVLSFFTMSRKHKCPRCKTLLSCHSFGPAFSKCEGPDATVLQDHVQDCTAVDELHDAAETSVDESHDDSVVPSELSLSLEAQQSQNTKRCAELAVLQQQ